ncbi:hypothetical protein DCC79_07300 [bacterium]|nr:MAG: hypothetical protein DCC79_07300 [bacterium]
MRPSSLRPAFAIVLGAALAAAAIAGLAPAPAAWSAPLPQAPAPTDTPVGATEEPTATETLEPTVEVPTETPSPTPTVTMTLPPPPMPVTPTATRGPDDDEDDDDEHRAPQAACGGAILGLVFVDADRDGRLGKHEGGHAGAEVTLRGAGVVRKQASNGAGQYRFDGLADGTYDVSIAGRSGWRVTTADRYQVASRCDTVQGIDFGLARHASDTGARRLPATGVADLPRSGLLGAVALALGVVALVGFGWERRRAR